MPGNHAQLAPSAASRWMACPGSIAAIAALPPEQQNTGSAAAEQGTRRHALIEWRFHHPNDPWPTEVDEHKILSDDIQAVLKIWKYISEHPAYQRREQTGFYAASEQQVEIGEPLGFPKDLCFGTVDFPLVEPGCVEIVDAKFGHTPIPPDGWQLKLYLIGFLRTLVDPETAQFLPEYAQAKRVKLTILAPEQPQVVNFHDTLMDDVTQWIEEARKGIAATQDPNAPRIPNPGCKYCPAGKAMTCPEYVQATGQAIAGPGVDPTPATAPPPIATAEMVADIAEVRLTQDPNELGLEEIGRLLDQALLVEGFFKNLREHAHKRISEGQQIPGWKLVTGRRAREWNDDEEETVAALRKMGLKVAEVYRQVLQGPAVIEKLEKMTKSRTYAERLKGLWHWKDGKPTLAPQDDDRPSIREPSEAFTNLDQPAAEKLPWEE